MWMHWQRSMHSRERERGSCNMEWPETALDIHSVVINQAQRLQIQIFRSAETLRRSPRGNKETSNRRLQVSILINRWVLSRFETRLLESAVAKLCTLRSRALQSIGSTDPKPHFKNKEVFAWGHTQVCWEGEGRQRENAQGSGDL